METFEIILTLKSLHIIGVVVWFSGLFYLGRLYVYDREARDESEPARSILTERLGVMERRLYYGITWPGMVFTVPLGVTLIIWYGMGWWLITKIALVVALIAYHLKCGHIRKQFVQDTCNWTSRHFRLWNEVPTLLLFAIVFLVVLKDAANPVYVIVGLAALTIAILVTIKSLAMDKPKA